MRLLYDHPPPRRGPYRLCGYNIRLWPRPIKRGKESCIHPADPSLVSLGSDVVDSADENLSHTESNLLPNASKLMDANYVKSPLRSSYPSSLTSPPASVAQPQTRDATIQTGQGLFVQLGRTSPQTMITNTIGSHIGNLSRTQVNFLPNVDRAIDANNEEPPRRLFPPPEMTSPPVSVAQPLNQDATNQTSQESCAHLTNASLLSALKWKRIW